MKGMRDADDPWTRVRGPAAAAIASVEPIGWTMTTWQQCDADTGEKIDLARCRPTKIVGTAKDAVARKI